MEFSNLTIALSTLSVTYVFFRLLLSYTQDKREPPAVETLLPFISPILGMGKKNAFYVGIRDKFRLPMVTLRLPFMRIYVINSTSLITLAQRQFKVLSFTPVESKAVINVTGASKRAAEILQLERDDVGPHAYAATFDKAIHPAVSPGPGLDAMGRAAIDVLERSLREHESHGPRTAGLVEWIRTEISHATTEAVFGPLNPYRDPALLKAFWVFEKGIVVLLLQLFPRLFARKALRARELLVGALEHYFRNGGHEQGSALVQCRYAHSVEWDVPIQDIARFELGGTFAILPNTVYTSFWVIYHMYSDPVVLDDCRCELDKVVQFGSLENTIDIAEVKSKCPILLSTVKEVLRCYNNGTSPRIALEDHMLGNEFLIKKGSTIMMPAAVQHTDKNNWGHNVADFDRTRFVRVSGKPRHNPVAFRGFGGGTTLCPGRNFATTEILAFAALVALRFDVEPVGGKWVHPTTNNAGSHFATPDPDHDIDVKITPRDPAKRWKVMLSGSEKSMQLVAEDMLEK